MKCHRSRYLIQFDGAGEIPARKARRRRDSPHAGKLLEVNGGRDERHNEEHEEAEYLREVPKMPDFLAHLAGFPVLTPAEQLCIGRQVERMCQQIRAARTAWEKTQPITVESL